MTKDLSSLSKEELVKLLEQHTATTEFECSGWLSKEPNSNGNLAVAIPVPVLQDGNVIKQNNEAGIPVVAGDADQRMWIQLIPNTSKNDEEGWIVKISGKAKSVSQYQAEQEAKEAKVKAEDNAKPASEEVAF